jgi:hypothetical protein
MRWGIKSLSSWIRCSLLSAFFLSLVAGVVDAGVQYVWPVSGSEDIIGTYCDYRDTPERFHTGWTLLDKAAVTDCSFDRWCPKWS